MAVTEQALLEALKQVVDPLTGTDFVSTKAVRKVQISPELVRFDLEIGYPAKSHEEGLRAALVAAAQTVAGVSKVQIDIHTKLVAHAVQRGVQLLPGVKNIVAVASGKGGVGKTWFAITLTHALARAGRRTLLFDGDLGLANVDIQLALMPKHDLGSVVAGKITLNQAATAYKEGGFEIIASPEMFLAAAAENETLRPHR